MIREIKVDKNLLRIKTNHKLLDSLLLLKVYLNNNDNVLVSGVTRVHHLVDDVEFVLKVKKGDPKKIMKEIIDIIIKDLENKKI